MWLSRTPIYVYFLEGIDAPKGHCLRLDHYIYGIVQYSRIWWKTFSAHLKKHVFEMSKADKYLYIKQSEFRIFIFILHVDNSFFIDDKAAVKHEIIDIKRVFRIKVQGTLQEYLGFKFTLEKNKSTICVTQLHLVKKLIEKHKIELTNRVYKTPSAPDFTTSLKQIKNEDILPDGKM